MKGPVLHSQVPADSSIKHTKVGIPSAWESMYRNPRPMKALGRRFLPAFFQMTEMS